MAIFLKVVLFLNLFHLIFGDTKIIEIKNSTEERKAHLIVSKASQ